MKIAFFEIKSWEKLIIQNFLKSHKLIFFEEPINENNIHLVSDIDILSVFIYSKVSSRVIDSLPNLKFIETRSTGFDHIDLPCCKSRKIKVSNVPFYGENTVAEHTFALILSLSRNVHKSYMRSITGDYGIEGLKGFDLKGKTIGVVGAGHIGQHVIRIAKGFEMSVIAFDPFPNQKLSKQLGFKYVSLDYLLKNSDIITLHLPLRKETFHIIGKSELKKMKNGGLLINTSRGDLVDTKALLESLEKGRIGGLGLDVIEGETLIKEEKELLHLQSSNIKSLVEKDERIIRNEKVVFTPHIAFFSQEALERILETSIQNIQQFIKGKPQNIIS